MAILDPNGFPYSYETQKFATAANRYDRSQPSEPLFTQDFERLVPDIDRKALVSGSRKAFQNFGPYRGAIIQKAQNAVGRGWDPKFIGRDPEWGKEASLWLRDQWFGFCDMRGPGFDFKSNLWIDCVSIDRDGDTLIVFGDSDYPLVQRISANRIGQRLGSGSYSYGQFSNTTKVESGPYKGAIISHGVIRDRFGRVLAYRILGNTQDEDVDLPADNCIYVSDPMWHDQVRGEPSGANALKFIRGSMLSHEWEQMAMLMVSSIGLVEFNETGLPNDEAPDFSKPKIDDEGNFIAPAVETLAGGTVRYIKSNSGGKVEQIDHARPGDMWDRYQDRVVRLFAAGVDWPYELFWKTSDVNASFVRNIQERARQSVEDRQDTLKVPALRMMRWAIAKAIKTGILPKPKEKDDWWRWDFTMPRKFSIDPGKEAQQRREDYKIGLKNRSQIIREEGGDIDQMDDERILEVFNREKKIEAAIQTYGIEPDRRLFYMLAPNDQQPVEQTDPQTQPDPNAD